MELSGTNIAMINGDSETITVAAVDTNGDPLLLTAGDKITFTVKKSTYESNVAIQKVITEFVNGEAIIELAAADTINLSGGYFYDIQLDRADGTVTTIVKPSSLTVQRGVTT